MKSLRTTYLIDSNVLIYAINEASPKHRRAQQFLQDNINNIAVAQQNILESVRVLTHSKFPNPMLSHEALGSVLAITDNAKLLTPSKTTYYLFMDLIDKYKLAGDKIFDAYLIATALSNGVNVVATDNIKDFKNVSEIKAIDPFK
jgi:toxin-antitoxin system PIN domain toxin